MYYECRKLHPELPSQYTIKAIKDVISAYKSIKSNKHIIDEPVFKTHYSIRLDKRIYSKLNTATLFPFYGNKVAYFTIFR